MLAPMATLVVALLADAVRKPGDHKGRPYSRQYLRPVHLQKAFAPAKNCSALPSNNHTLILYYNHNTARQSGGLSYQRRSLYSLFGQINSLFRKKIFPVLICREFACKTLKLIFDLVQ
jgi:hypothetical protein